MQFLKSITLLLVALAVQFVCGDITIANKYVSVHHWPSYTRQQSINQESSCNEMVHVDTAIHEATLPSFSLAPGEAVTVPAHHDPMGGTSMKISREGGGYEAGVLQFEYAYGDEWVYYDLSDIDGSGPGSVGAPFRSANVHALPQTSWAGNDRCQPLECPAGTTCQDSYQFPKDDKNTHSCPLDSSFIVELCY